MPGKCSCVRCSGLLLSHGLEPAQQGESCWGMPFTEKTHRATNMAVQLHARYGCTQQNACLLYTQLGCLSPCNASGYCSSATKGISAGSAMASCAERSRWLSSWRFISSSPSGDPGAAPPNTPAAVSHVRMRGETTTSCMQATYDLSMTSLDDAGRSCPQPWQ